MSGNKSRRSLPARDASASGVRTDGLGSDDMEMDVVIRYRRPNLVSSGGMRAFGAFLADLAEYARGAPAGFTIVSMAALGDTFTPPAPTTTDSGSVDP